MDRREYIDHVASALRRTTRRERQAIRNELDGHIQDHMEALIELGYGEELAESRTLERMGDPAEIGRALDREYPLRWLVVGWLAKAMALLLALVLAGPLAARLPGACQSLLLRWSPKSVLDISQVREDFDPLGLDAWDVDEAVRLQDLHIRVYQAAFQPAHEGGDLRLAVAYWQTDPLQENVNWLYGYSLKAQVNGEDLGVGTQPVTEGVNLYSVCAAPGDTLTLTWEAYGETAALEIELPEVVP